MTGRALHAALGLALGALSLALAGAGPDAVPLRWRATPELTYRLADLERVERRLSGPVETRTYRTEKRYRWQVVDRPGGLTVKLGVLSSKMHMDGATVPKDLGGHTGEDRIDDRGAAAKLGPVEDPIRLEPPFPAEALKPGDGWSVRAPSTAGWPGVVSHDVRFVDRRNVKGVACARLEVKSQSDGVDAARGARVVVQQKGEVLFDPARGIVMGADVRTRLEETLPPTGDPTVRVTRITRRKLVLEPQ